MENLFAVGVNRISPRSADLLGQIVRGHAVQNVIGGGTFIDQSLPFSPGAMEIAISMSRDTSSLPPPGPPLYPSNNTALTGTLGKPARFHKR